MIAQPQPNLSDLLAERLSKNSGFDERRPYVGMSKAGDCPRCIYTEFMNGTAATLDNHVGAWLGYTMEAAVQNLLAGELKPGEELSAFSGRVKGHTDGEWRGELVEIKSVTNEKLLRVLDDYKVERRHFEQVQAYMHFGRWDRCHVIYVPRDFGRPAVLSVTRNGTIGERIEHKFIDVLEAIDAKQSPQCECRRCR